MIQELHWKKLEAWKSLGVYTDRPKLGPGGWSTGSYFYEVFSKKDRKRDYVAYGYGSTKFWSLIFERMMADDVGLSGINMFWMRDRDANPNHHHDLYAFFENQADAWIFHTYLSDLTEDERYGSFFKFR